MATGIAREATTVRGCSSDIVRYRAMSTACPRAIGEPGPIIGTSTTIGRTTIASEDVCGTRGECNRLRKGGPQFHRAAVTFRRPCDPGATPDAARAALRCVEQDLAGRLTLPAQAAAEVSFDVRTGMRVALTTSPDGLATRLWRWRLTPERRNS